MKKMFIVLMFLLFTPFIYARELPVDVTATSVAVIDLDRNEIVLEKNADDEVVLASLTKMMTAYTVIDKVENLNKKVTITDKDLYALWGFTQIGLEEGDKVSYLDLLYGMMLYSGADASQALVNHISGNNEEFIKLMNEETQNMGLRHTVYKDSFGRDDGNVSTAREQAYFLKQALDNELYKKIFTTTNKRLSNGIEAVNYVRSIATFHGLDSDILLGNKPGYTEVAGLLLASYVNINGTDYGIIVCHSKENEYLSTHVLDTYKIIDYLKTQNYSEKTILQKGLHVKRIAVENSTINEYVVTVDKDMKAYLTEEEFENLQYEYHITDMISSTNEIGDNLGYIDILSNGEVINTYNVYLKDNIYSLTRESKIIITAVVVLVIFIIAMMAANLSSKPKRRKR